MVIYDVNVQRIRRSKLATIEVLALVEVQTFQKCLQGGVPLYSCTV